MKQSHFKNEEVNQGGGKTSLNSNGSGYSEDISYTLNAVDNHAVCFSQDAYDKYTASDKSPTLKNSGGNFGGGSETLISSVRCKQEISKE